MKKQLEHQHLWIFLFFLLSGLLTLGPIQWGSLTILGSIRAIYKIGIPLIFLTITVLLHKNEGFNRYRRVVLAFFIASFAFFVSWLISQSINFPTNTIEGFTLEKLKEAALVIT